MLLQPFTFYHFMIKMVQNEQSCCIKGLMMEQWSIKGPICHAHRSRDTQRQLEMSVTHIL